MTNHPLRAIFAALWAVVSIATGMAGCADIQNTKPVIAAPVDLRGAPGNGQVTLSWAGLESAAYYRVFYSPVAGVTEATDRWKDTPVGSGAVSTFVDGLTNDQTYYFRVASMSGANDIGLLSGEIEATPFSPPAPPTGLAAAGNNGGGIDLTWEASSNGNVNRYYIHYNSSGSVTKNDPYIDIFGRETTSHTHGDLDNETTYYYRIAAFDERGGGVEGELSDEVSAKPKVDTGGGGTYIPVDSSCTTGAHAGASWSVSVCGPGNRLEVNQGTIGDDNSALGTRGIANGKVSFKTAGIVNSDFTQGRDHFLVMFMAITGGSEHNYHIGAWGQGAGVIGQLTAQKFSGGALVSEIAGGYTNLDFTSREMSLQWNCTWGGGNASCVVTDGAGNVWRQFNVSTAGDFGILNYFAAGQRAYPSTGYPTVPITVWDMRFSVF